MGQEVVPSVFGIEQFSVPTGLIVELSQQRWITIQEDQKFFSHQVTLSKSIQYPVSIQLVVVRKTFMLFHVNQNFWSGCSVYSWDINILSHLHFLCNLRMSVCTENLKHIFVNYCRYFVGLPDGPFYEYMSKSDDWIHTIFNFIGSNDGEGIRIYSNGKQIKSEHLSRKTPGENFAFKGVEGNRKIAIGRYYSGSNQLAGSVHVDELLVFNHALTEAEIKILSKKSA